MNRWIPISLAAAFALSGCSVSGQFYSSEKARPSSEKTPSRHDRLPALLERCRSATKAEIFEGLPHPLSERAAYAVERRRSDTFENHGFRFYSPGMNLPAATRRKTIETATREAAFLPWNGPKFCGGFHPDLLLRFKTPQGPVDIQLCFGCGEAMIFDGSTAVRADLPENVLSSLRQTADAHRTKRPKTPQP